MKKKSFQTARFIAIRYLFSKKKHNIINIISIISTIGILISTAALIIILSVFNGMSDLISTSFNAFNPDYRITLGEGKSFAVDSFPFQRLSEMKAVKSVQPVVSDMVLLTYQDRQALVYLKGVENTYLKDNDLKKLMIDGEFALTSGSTSLGVLGAIAAGTLQIKINSYEQLKLYYPKRSKKNLSNAATAFNTELLLPVGIFASNTEYDERYVFSNIEFARQLMEYENEVTSVEVFLNDPSQYAHYQDKISDIVGNKYKVDNKYQQEELLFKTMKSEKFIIYIILAFILIVAAFNIIGTLGMLILEKKFDISILHSIGADNSLIKRIFIIEGMCISFVGGLLGMFLGFIICLLQQTFHIIKLGGGDAGYIIQYYPVQMSPTDFIIVLLTILLISLTTSSIPVKYMSKIKRTSI